MQQCTSRLGAERAREGVFGCFEDILGEFIGDAGIQPLEESKTATVCQGKVKQIVQCSRNLLKLLKAVSWSHMYYNR